MGRASHQNVRGVSLASRRLVSPERYVSVGTMEWTMIRGEGVVAEGTMVIPVAKIAAMMEGPVVEGVAVMGPMIEAKSVVGAIVSVAVVRMVEGMMAEAVMVPMMAEGPVIAIGRNITVVAVGRPTTPAKPPRPTGKAVKRPPPPAMPMGLSRHSRRNGEARSKEHYCYVLSNVAHSSISCGKVPL